MYVKTNFQDTAHLRPAYQQFWKILNLAVGDKGYICTEHIL